MNFKYLIVAFASFDLIKLFKKVFQRKFIDFKEFFHFINFLKQLKINILGHFQWLLDLIQLNHFGIINRSLQEYLGRLLALLF